MTTAPICLTVVSTAVSFQDVGIRRTLAPSRRIVKPRNQTTHTSSTGQTTTPRLNVNLGIIGVEDHRLDLGASAAGRGSDLDPVTDQLRVRVLGGRARQQSPGEQI